MTQQWKFTALEFIVLCEQYRGGSLPRPFQFVSDEEITVDELERRKRVTWEELRHRLDGSFDGVLEVLRAPELFVRASSWDELDMDNMAKEQRLHAARAGALAYLFEQAPALLTYDTPAFTITECDPRQLATVVIDSLPPMKAGRLPDIPIVTDSAEHVTPTPGRSYVEDDREDTPVYRTQQFFQQRAVRTGAITVVQGRSKFGPRGIHEIAMMWRDVAGDGRYVMSLDAAPVAVASSRETLIERIEADIRNLMRRLESHWESGRPDDRY
ncbi:ESX secretion-associated protein EspG [Nocardia sp. NPDC051052]|uniref:ESX secretion-associated protein EspG n=1 Tax=Nocardia sp. NPDC051052 TaxID=3364322 RepID=UPI0037B8C1F7